MNFSKTLWIFIKWDSSPQKNKNCHNLLAHMLFQTLMVLNILLYIFWETSQCFIYLLINGTLWVTNILQKHVDVDQWEDTCSWSIIDPFSWAELYRSAILFPGFCLLFVLIKFVLYLDPALLHSRVTNGTVFPLSGQLCCYYSPIWAIL